MSYKKVLVTGGAGFIGSHLVDRLVAEGFEVTVLDNLSTGRIENINHLLENEKFRFIEGDVRDKKNVEEALEGVDAIYHLAAVTSVPFSIEHPKVTFEVNVDGTRNLLEACLDAGVGRFVFVSSCAVYGEPKYLPVDEVHPTCPVSPYAKSKLEAEGLCMGFHGKGGFEATIFRVFNVYGPRMRCDDYAGVIAKFISRLRSGLPPVIYGDGFQTRDFVYVGDVVEVLISALKSRDAMGKVFNVGSGLPVSVNELVNLLLGMFGFDDVGPVYSDERKGDIRRSYANISLVRKCLGFEPKISLKDGLSLLLSG